jgi:preprotein translocase subunit SecE
MEDNKKDEALKTNEELNNENNVEEVKAEATDSVEETKKEKKNSTKSEVENKIKKQIEKKQEKQERLGIYRIGAYLKEEHKWENYVFLIVSVIVLVLGMLILNGALVVRDNFPLIGGHSTAFGWTLVGVAALGTLYGLYPFFKPAFPEFKKITWLTVPKFIANTIRVFVFMAIFIALFILYDMFIANIYVLIFR